MKKLSCRVRQGILGAALLSVFAPVESAIAADEKFHVLPHRAYYTMHADRIEERTGVQAMSGRMVFEISGSACGGWAVNLRFANIFTLQNGETRAIDTVDSYFESGDGKKMQFSSLQSLNGKLAKETEGAADIDLKDGVSLGGTGTLKLPKELNFKLPKDTIFPLAHRERLLNLAHAGETFDRVGVYEGDADKTVYVAATVIGKKRARLESPTPAQAALANMAYWPIAVSYYDVKKKTRSEGEQLPSHQVSVSMFANGVSGGVSIADDDFTLKGELEKLEMLEVVTCD